MAKTATVNVKLTELEPVKELLRRVADQLGDLGSIVARLAAADPVVWSVSGHRRCALCGRRTEDNRSGVVKHADDCPWLDASVRIAEGIGREGEHSG